MKFPSSSVVKFVGPKHEEILQGTRCDEYAISQCVTKKKEKKLVVVECHAIVDPKIIQSKSLGYAYL